MMKKTIQLFVILFNLLLISCKGHEFEDGLGTFDWSSVTNRFVFSYTQNGFCAIYTADENGQNVELIAEPTMRDSFYIQPRFSENGDKIVYLAYSVQTKRSNIIVFNLADKSSKQIPAAQIITEAIFSRDGNKIFYCAASEISNYSPIAPKAPHGMDIFFIDENYKMKKITDISAYRVSNLELYSNELKEDLIAFVYSANRIYFFDPFNFRELFDVTPSIALDTNPFISDFAFIEKDTTLRFSTSYFIYEIEKSKINTDTARTLARPSYSTLGNVRYHENGEKIFFTTSAPNNGEIFYFTIDSPANIRRIRLEMP